MKDIVIYCSLFQGATLLGEPDAIVDLGNTEVPKELFTEYISSLQESTYRQIYLLFLLLQSLAYFTRCVHAQSFCEQSEKANTHV